MPVAAPPDSKTSPIGREHSQPIAPFRLTWSTPEEGLTPDDAERMLAEWAASFGGRDAVVLAAHHAGVPKHRIHVLTGIARTTLDRILSEENPMAASIEVKSREQELLRQRTM